MYFVENSRIRHKENTINRCIISETYWVREKEGRLSKISSDEKE